MNEHTLLNRDAFLCKVYDLLDDNYDELIKFNSKFYLQLFVQDRREVFQFEDLLMADDANYVPNIVILHLLVFLQEVN